MIIIDKLPMDLDVNSIIFDIDGTITRWKDIKSFLEKSLNQLGILYNDDALDGLFQAMKYRETHAIITGESSENVYSMLLESFITSLHQYGVSGEDLKNVMFEFEPLETYVSDETVEEIQRLSEKYKLFVYTNWFRKQAIKKLDKYNLTQYFTAIHSSEDNFIKYSKVGFLWLLDNYRLDPKSTIHVGDSENDIVPSHNAGLNSIYLDYDIKSSEDITSEKMKLILAADASVTEFGDVRKVLTMRRGSF